MHLSSPFSVTRVIAIGMALLTSFPTSSFALDIFARDLPTGDDYSYNPEGVNGGYGFGPWNWDILYQGNFIFDEDIDGHAFFNATANGHAIHDIDGWTYVTSTVYGGREISGVSPAAERVSYIANFYDAQTGLTFFRWLTDADNYEIISGSWSINGVESGMPAAAPLQVVLNFDKQAGQYEALFFDLSNGSSWKSDKRPMLSDEIPYRLMFTHDSFVSSNKTMSERGMDFWDLVVMETPDAFLTVPDNTSGPQSVEVFNGASTVTLSVELNGLTRGGTVAVSTALGDFAPPERNRAGFIDQVFDVVPLGNPRFTSATTVFEYDETALGGLAEDQIEKAVRDNGIALDVLDVVVDTEANTITVPNHSGFSTWYFGTAQAATEYYSAVNDWDHY